MLQCQYEQFVRLITWKLEGGTNRILRQDSLNWRNSASRVIKTLILYLLKVPYVVYGIDSRFYLFE